MSSHDRGDRRSFAPSPRVAGIALASIAAAVAVLAALNIPRPWLGIPAAIVLACACVGAAASLLGGGFFRRPPQPSA